MVSTSGPRRINQVPGRQAPRILVIGERHYPLLGLIAKLNAHAMERHELIDCLVFLSQAKNIQAWDRALLIELREKVFPYRNNPDPRISLLAREANSFLIQMICNPVKEQGKVQRGAVPPSMALEDPEITASSLRDDSGILAPDGFDEDTHSFS